MSFDNGNSIMGQSLQVYKKDYIHLDLLYFLTIFNSSLWWVFNSATGSGFQEISEGWDYFPGF